MPTDAGSPPQKIDRLLRIIGLIQGGTRWTPAALADELSVTERTVFRYLETLQRSGVPIVFDRELQAYRLDDGAFLPPVHLTAEEACAIAALCRDVGERDQIAFMRPAARALGKITAALPDDVRDEVESIADAMEVRTASSNIADGSEDVYAAMRGEIRDRRAVVCRYEAAHGRGSDEDFDFEPWRLFYSVRAWYVVGWHGGRDAVRTLKLSRFARVRATQRPYDLPADFSLDDHLGNAWQLIRGSEEFEVVIDFSAAFAETASETRWHRTQSIEGRADGGVRFRCTVAGLDEIVWWVLSMGPNCTVVEPPALRERVRGLAAATAAAYDEG